jgi:hypothetical protein
LDLKKNIGLCLMAHIFQCVILSWPTFLSLHPAAASDFFKDACFTERTLLPQWWESDKFKNSY